MAPCFHINMYIVLTIRKTIITRVQVERERTCSFQLLLCTTNTCAPYLLYIFFTFLSARKAKKATTQLLHINLCFQNIIEKKKNQKPKKGRKREPPPLPPKLVPLISYLRTLFNFSYVIFTDVYMLGSFPRRRKSREEKNVGRFSGQGLIYTLGQTPSSSLGRCSIYHQSGLSIPLEWCSEGGIVLL